MIVYLLKEENGGDIKYKIGRTSKSVKTRINKLKTGNANNLICVSQYETNRAVRLENYLHNYFNSNRIEGEWFNLPESIEIEFSNICKQIEDNIILLETKNTWYQQKYISKG